MRKPGSENWTSEGTGIQTQICVTPKPGLYTTCFVLQGQELAGTGQDWPSGNGAHDQRKHGEKMSRKWGCIEPDPAQESIWRVQAGVKRGPGNSMGAEGALRTGSGAICPETQSTSPTQICTQDRESLRALLTNQYVFASAEQRGKYNVCRHKRHKN